MAQARPTLKKGMTGKKGSPVGEAIRIWRTLMGLAPAAGVTVYDFGPATVNATMAWQGTHGLADPKRKDGLGDGIVGPKTWAKYDSMQYGPPPPPPPTPHPSAQQAAQVIQAQATAKKPPPKPSTAPAAAVAAATIKAQTAAKTPPPKPAVTGAAQVAAATIAQRAGAVTASVQAPIRSAIQSVQAHIPQSVKQAHTQAVQTVQAAPLWLKIVGGAISSLLVYTGIKKAVS